MKSLGEYIKALGGTASSAPEAPVEDPNDTPVSFPAFPYQTWVYRPGGTIGTLQWASSIASDATWVSSDGTPFVSYEEPAAELGVDGLIDKARTELPHREPRMLECPHCETLTLETEGKCSGCGAPLGRALEDN